MNQSSTDQPQSDPHPFLQDSSHFTQMPSEQRSQEPQIVLPKADQKIVSLTKPVLAQMDSQGEIRINITVPASALTLGKLLGEGGFGSVYAGLYNGEPVAIKRLKMQHLTDKAIEELRNEAKIMFQLGLESKYIVPLKKICLESPYYSLVMELMPKGSLYDLLRNGQPLPWESRFQIALDAAWGLKDLHGYRILHRDLKSMNILLDDRLRAKLADFGLAKVKHETSSQSSVAKGGTVLWMAPELFDDEPRITTESDIYSFGMVLWELAARAIPYAKWRPEVAGIRIAQGKKEEIPGDCPLELKKIIESCWELTPTKRPTAIQVVERLKPLVISQEQKVQMPESPQPAQAAGSNDEEMKKLLAEVMKLKLEKAEDDRRRVELEKQVEEHARLKAEIEREREIKRQKAELKKSPVSPKLEKPGSLPPAPQPGIKKPMTSEPVSPRSGILSSSPQTLMPKPVIPRLDRGIQPVDAKTLGQLLRFVAEGEQDKAEVMIQKDKNLLLHAGTVTDLSGREFKPITAFQYALWAMDWHMWTMIQKYLPEEQQREQFEGLETKSTLHGKHFSLQPLIGALQSYVDNYDSLSWKMFESKREHHWQKVVGGAQRLLPAHVINEYCRPDRAFYPCPEFTEASLPRGRNCDEGDCFTASCNGGRLGDKFGVVRGGLYGGRRVAGRAYAGGMSAEGDKFALQSLSKARTQQLELLASQLKMSSYRLGA